MNVRLDVRTNPPVPVKLSSTKAVNAFVLAKAMRRLKNVQLGIQVISMEQRLWLQVVLPVVLLVVPRWSELVTTRNPIAHRGPAEVIVRIATSLI